MQLAHFRADGSCFSVADMEMTLPEGGFTRLVPQGTQSGAIWWNGVGVVEAAPFAIDLPASLEVSPTPYTFDIPAGVIAVVDGTRQVGRAEVDLQAERDVHIVFCGAMNGDHVLRVQTYETRRREQYPPIGDQLDALWKLLAGENGDALTPEAAAMLAQIQAVKDANPKPGEVTSS